jgi:hypothetical protein
MKVTRKEDQTFKPVTIELTFESYDELTLFKNLMGNLSHTQAESIANYKCENSSVIHTIYTGCFKQG